MKFKKILAFALAVVMTLSVSATAFADERYLDIKDHWAEKDIEELSDMGIIQGSDGLIRPEDYISRAELVTLVYNMLGSAGETNSSEYSYNDATKLWNSNSSAGSKINIGNFSDYSSDKWYAYALNWAVGNGVISGYEDGTIRADNPVTRQETAVIFMRALSIGSSGGNITAKDAADVSDWAEEAVSTFMTLGYMNGDTDGNINPRVNIKRGEAFKMLRNMIGTYIRENGEYSGDYGNKLVIVANGTVVLKNINCRAILVSSKAGEPEIKGKGPKVKIFGRKKLNVSDTAGIIINSSSGSNWGGGSSGGNGGNGGSSSSSRVTLKFNANGGVFDNDKEVYSTTCSRGVTIRSEMPENPIRRGYDFVGWFESRSEANDAHEKDIVDVKDKVTSSMTLYAGWERGEEVASFDTAKLEDKSAQPQTELIKDYDVSLKIGDRIEITGTDLKKYVYEPAGIERYWIAFEVTFADYVMDAIDNGEELRWYIGIEDDEKDIDWTGYIEDELTDKKDKSFTVYMDAEKSEDYKYFIFELPKEDDNGEIMVYSIDMSELTLYDYESEPSESSGVFFGVTDNAELMDDVSLEFSLDEVNTFDASGTLKFYKVSDEESGNYIELKITLPQSVDTEKAVVMFGKDEVEDLNALRVPVTAEKDTIIITVDFDGEGEKFTPVEYKVTTKGLTLEENTGEGTGETAE